METVIPFKPTLVVTKKAQSGAHSNEKGGVGKTTTMFNQAYRLADQGSRVLVIDFDGQRNMSKLLIGSMKEVEWIEKYGFTSAELFRSELDNNDITVYRTTIHENLFALPAHKEKIAGVIAAGKDAVSMVVNPKKYIDCLDFDYIFIDTPPSLGVTQVAAINAVDYIFVPVTVDDFSNEGLMSLLKTMNNVKKNLRSNVKLGSIYINFYKKPSARRAGNPYKEILDQVERDYAKFLIPSYIPDSISIKEARMERRACWVSAKSGNALTVGRRVRETVDIMNEIMK